MSVFSTRLLVTVPAILALVCGAAEARGSKDAILDRIVAHDTWDIEVLAQDGVTPEEEIEILLRGIAAARQLEADQQHRRAADTYDLTIDWAGKCSSVPDAAPLIVEASHELGLLLHEQLHEPWKALWAKDTGLEALAHIADEAQRLHWTARLNHTYAEAAHASGRWEVAIERYDDAMDAYARLDDASTPWHEAEMGLGAMFLLLLFQRCDELPPWEARVAEAIGRIPGGDLELAARLEYVISTCEEARSRETHLRTHDARRAELVVDVGHHDHAWTAGFSPDGRHIVTVASDWSIAIWDVATGDLVRRLKRDARNGLYHGAWYDPTGMLLLAQGDDHAELWDTRTWRLLHVLDHREVNDLAVARESVGGVTPILTPEGEGRARTFWEGLDDARFSPDGRLVVTTSGGQVVVWGSSDGRPLHWFEPRERPNDDVYFTNFTDDDVYWTLVSPNNRALVTIDASGRATAWSLRSGRLLRDLGSEDPVVSATFSHRGDKLATSHVEGGLRTWSARTWTPLRRLRGSDPGLVRTSPDDRSLLTMRRDGAAALLPAAGGEPRWFGHGDWIWAAEFSPDGSLLATGSVDGSVSFWDTRTAELLWRYVDPRYWPTLVFEDHETKDRIRSLEFSRDGRFLVCARASGPPLMLDIEARAARHQLEGKTLELYAASLSPDGRTLVAAGASDHATIWDLEAGAPLHRLHVGDGQVQSAAHSGDGASILTVLEDGSAQIWDTSSGERLWRLDGVFAEQDAWSSGTPRIITSTMRRAWVWDARSKVELASYLHDSSVSAAALSPDGKLALSGDENGNAILWDAESGELLRRLESPTEDRIYTARFSPNGERALLAGSNFILVLHVDARAPDTRIATYGSGEYARFSHDGTLVLSPSSRTIEVYDSFTGERLLRAHNPVSANLWGADFSHDGSRILVNGWGDAAILDTASGALLHRLGEQVDGVHSASFSSDGSQIVTAGNEGTICLWDAATGRMIAKLVTFTDGTWAVVDPDGRYDASADGDVDGLHWVIDGQPFELQQLHAYYYDPGLLAKLTGFRTELPRAVPPLDEIMPPPRVTVETSPGNPRVTISLEDMGGGIGELTVLLNGSDVSELFGPCEDPTAGCHVDLSGSHHFVHGAPNKIVAWATDGAQRVETRGAEAIATSGGQARQDPPDLWAVVVGVGDYVGDPLDLLYPPRDASRFAAALELAGRRGFGEERVHVTMLAAGDGRTLNKDDLDRAFDALQAGDSEDTLVVYLSGHGVAYQDEGTDDFFFLLPDAASLQDLSNPTLRKHRAVSGRELQDWILRSPARRRMIVLDTCSAGKAIDSFGEVKQLSSDAVRAHARARRRTGAWILAGAAADRPSYESTRFGQGLLTYTLLEGMHGPALDEGDQVVVSQLFAHADEQVPRYAQGIGGVQRPLLRRGDHDFHVGELAPEDRSQIPLQSIRPVFVRSVFLQEDHRPDRVGLTRAVNAALRDLSGRSEPPLVLFDTDHFADAWQIVGSYRRTDGGLWVVAHMEKIDGTSEDAHEIHVSANDVTEASEQLLTAVIERLRD